MLAVTLPSIRTPPETSNVAWGDVVPMPTLPPVYAMPVGTVVKGDPVTGTPLTLSVPV